MAPRGGKKAAAAPKPTPKPPEDALDWLWRPRDEPCILSTLPSSVCPIIDATSRIIKRVGDFNPILYHIEVTYNDPPGSKERLEVDLRDILDYVSELELERYENEDFEQLAQAENIAAEAERQEEEKASLARNERPREDQHPASRGNGRGRGSRGRPRGRPRRGGILSLGRPADQDTDELGLNTTRLSSRFPRPADEEEDDAESMDTEPPLCFPRDREIPESPTLDDQDEDSEDHIPAPRGFHLVAPAMAEESESESDDDKQIDYLRAGKPAPLSPTLMKSAFVANSALSASPASQKIAFPKVMRNTDSSDELTPGRKIERQIANDRLVREQHTSARRARESSSEASLPRKRMRTESMSGSGYQTSDETHHGKVPLRLSQLISSSSEDDSQDEDEADQLRSHFQMHTSPKTKTSTNGHGSSSKAKEANPDDDDVDTYIVEDILDDTRSHGRTYYRVKWVGFREARNWLTRKDLEGASDMLREYWERQRRKNKKGVDWLQEKLAQE